MLSKNELYIDTCFPFGLRSAPKLFNILTDLLEWIVKEHGVTVLLHYLVVHFGTVCQHNLDILIHICDMVITLATEKAENPTTSYLFGYLT